jgi:hypothetical protein
MAAAVTAKWSPFARHGQDVREKAEESSASGRRSPPRAPDDPRLTQLCPNPACMGIIEQANAYVRTKLAGRLATNYAPLFTSPAYRQNREALIVALAEGDLEATKTVCRAWCKLVIGWTQQQRAEADAHRLDGMVV